MKNKPLNQNTSFIQIDRFFRRIYRQTLGILFSAFMFIFLHSAIHNDFDHQHDSHCTIYVLEQFYFGLDIVHLEPLPTLFFPFIFITFWRYFYYLKPYRFFTIRAPPSYSSF